MYVSDLSFFTELNSLLSESNTLSDLQDFMKQHASDTYAYDTQFHLTYLDKEAIADEVNNFLGLLHIPLNKKGRYLGQHLSLYEFFKELDELDEGKNPALNLVLACFQEQESENLERKFRIAAALLLCVLIACIPLEVFGVLTLVQGLVAATLFFPGVGIVYSVGLGAFRLYQNANDKNIQYYNLLYNNFFVILNSVVRCMAYCALLAAVSASNNIAAGLFILDSLVAVANQLVNLYQLYQYQKKHLPDTSIRSSQDLETLLIDKQVCIRAFFDFKKVRNEVVVQLGTTIAMVGIVVAMHSLPPSLMLTFGTFAAMGVVYLAQSLLLWGNKKMTHSRMLNEFLKVEKDPKYVPLSSKQPDVGAFKFFSALPRLSDYYLEAASNTI